MTIYAKCSAIALAAAVSVGALAIPGVSKAAELSNPDVTRIITNCKSSIADCMRQFQQSENTGAQLHIDNSFSILGLFKSTNLTFWGVASHLHYTEVTIGAIEYQVGFGYVMYAKQLDAKPSGTGIVGGVAIDANGEVGVTHYSASLIGLAPDKPLDDKQNCASPGIAVDEALLCAIDLEPTVTPEYFKSTSDKFETAYANWGKNPPANNGSTSALCPQVINYRLSADHKITGLQVTLNNQQIAERRWLLAQLSTVCSNRRPNAHVSFKNGDPGDPTISADLKVGGADNTLNRSQLVVTYYRNRWYIADTPLRSTASPRGEFYASSSDHSAELYFKGLTAAAALPSILSAFVTLDGSVQNHRLDTVLRCSAGAQPTMGKFDPEADSNAFSALVTQVRTAVWGWDGRG